MNRDRKRLLFVNGHMKVGGGEKSLLDLLTHLDYTLFDVDLLLIEGKGEYFSMIPPQVNIIFVDTTKAYGALLPTIKSCIENRYFYALWYRIILLFTRLFGKKALYLLSPILHLRSHYDCAIAYRPGPCADLVAYAVRAKKKVCWWHNGKCDYTPGQIIEVDNTWKQFNNIVSVSEGCKKLITDYFSYPKEKILVVPNMIDSIDIIKKAGDNTPFSDNAELRFVTVCRLSEEKHLENIIYVMPRLIEQTGKRIKWYIVGSGPQEEYLSSLIHKSNLAHSIILLGQQINPYPYIKFADYYVSTSYQESQSISVLEAMSLNIPCVVTRTIGTDGYCRNNENCIMADPQPESLYKALVTMLGLSSEQKKDMSLKAYQIAVEEFSPNHVNVLLSQLFQ